MTDVPSNLIPTRISQLPEYTGSSQEGYLPYVYEGVTYKVRFSGVASAGEVPPSRTLTAGTGLTGGGDLSADRVFAISDGGVGADQLDATGVVAGVYGDASNVPTITVDANGRVSDVTTSPIVALGYVPESRVITAGDGLSGGGNLADDRSFSVNFSSVAPSPLGSASAGVANVAAREDHVHPAVDLSDMTETQGTLPLGRGGTGASLSPIAGAVAYSNGTHMSLTPVGVVGQVLVSGGVNAPSWVTLTGTGTVTSVNIDGATSGLNFIGGPITTAGVFTLQDPGFIQFDTAYGASRNTGRLWWNDDDNAKTLMVGGEGSDVDIKVGEQNYFRIKASAAITKGQVVMFTGTVGASGGLQAAPATGLTKATAGYIMGIAAEDIALNEWGYITEFGLIRQLDTTAFSDGDILYYDPDVVGGLRVGAPPAPAAKAELAAVVYSASNGSIFVRATHQFELEQLNDVETAAASDLDLLEYNGSSGVWRHRDPQLINVGGATNVLNGAANQLVYQTGSGSSSFVAAPTSANTFLEWSGSAFQWSANPLGTVTSVDVSGGTTGLTASGGPITSSGTITLGGTLAVANGGTGATDAATALTNLGAYPASNPDGYTNNTGTVTSVAATAGTGISVSGSPITASGTLTITNTAPDQTVTLTQGGTTTITGTYPNFTISSADQYDGTVTSVAATVPTGFTVGGSPITTSGTLAIGFDTGYSLPTDAEQANWDTAYTDRYKWDGGSSGLVAATGRTSLGLGTSAVLDAGVAGGVATLDGGGTVPTSQLPSAVIGAVSYQGTWNASTNTPTLTSSTGTQGYYYVVSVAGTTTLDGISDWGVGDWAIFNGSTWDKIDNTDAVTSVNGYTGTVVLDYSDVGAYADTNPAGYTTNTGTVTSVGGTGTVNGLTLSGTVTSSGNLTLGGALAISNADWSGTDLSVANGGTGVSSLTSGYLLKGNGTSPVSASVIYDNGTNVGIGRSPSTDKLEVAGSVKLTNLGAGQGLIGYNTSSQHWEIASTSATSSGVRFDVQGNQRLSINSAGNVTAAVDLRAPIFYDSINTAYYVDPNSPATAINVAGKIYGVNEFYTSTAQDSWAFRATTGASSNSSGLWFSGETARILLRDSSGTIKTQLSADGSTSTNQINGNPIFHDGYHPNADKWTTARTLSLSGDATGSVSWDGSANVTLSTTVVNDSHGHSFNNLLNKTSGTGTYQTSGDFRAPIFYDSNNTGYYGDFASNSSLSSLLIGTSGSIYSYDAAATGKLYFGSLGTDSSTHYHITTNMENVGGNYSKLDFRWYTGQRFYAHYAYGGFRFKEITTGSTLFSVGEGDLRVRAYDSISAPIFYDYNNTAYYVDPNGGSRMGSITADNLESLGNLTVNSGAVYRSDWTTRLQSPSDFVNGTLVSTDIPATASTGDSFVIEITGKSYSSSNPPFKAVAQGYLYNNTIIAFSGINYGGTFSSYIRVFEDGGVLKFWWPRITYWNSFNVNVMSMNGPTNGTITRNRVTSITNSTEPTGSKKQTINLAGFMRSDISATNSVDLRAPRFYDSNNTAYYVDPAATSILSGADFDGIVRITTGTVGPANTTDGLMFDGNYTNGQYRHRFRKRDDSGGIPLYLDYSAGTANSYTQLMKFGPNTADGSYLTVYGIIASNTDIRAPRFYDSDNTGYFVDPNSTSNTALRIRGGTLHGPNVSWGAYLSVGTNGHVSGSYGSVCVTNGNLHLDAVSGYSMYLNNYAGNDTYIRYAGSNRLAVYGPSNYTEAAGSLRAPIFYDSNNTGYYVDPASTTRLNRLYIDQRNDNYNVGSLNTTDAVSDWQSLTNTNGQFTVSQFNNFTNGSFSNHPTGVYQYGAVLSWRTQNHSFQLYASHTGDLSYKTQWQNDNYSGWLTPVVYGRNGGTSSGKTIYGSIYYDTDNTAYYVDPASTSNLNTTTTALLNSGNVINIGGTRNGSVATTAFRGIEFHNAGDANYSIGKPAGAWTQPLDVRFVTGVRLTANSAYDYGVSMWNMSGNYLMLSAGDGDNNVRIYSDLRVPIVYDSNNTGRYADLSSTGDSIRASGDIVAYYSDDRLKDRGDNIANALDKVQSLNGFHYTANETAQKFGYKANPQVGVSAQEVEAVLPEVVKDAAIGHGYKTVDYAKLVPLLIEAIKELKAEVETLKKG